jgi:hypothetical protein
MAMTRLPSHLDFLRHRTSGRFQTLLGAACCGNAVGNQSTKCDSTWHSGIYFFAARLEVAGNGTQASRVLGFGAGPTANPLTFAVFPAFHLDQPSPRRFQPFHQIDATGCSCTMCSRWVFDSDAANCRIDVGRAVCAGSDLGKATEAAVKRVKSAS